MKRSRKTTAHVPVYTDMGLDPNAQRPVVTESVPVRDPIQRWDAAISSVMRFWGFGAFLYSPPS